MPTDQINRALYGARSNKYHVSKKEDRTDDNIVFHSKREMKRYQDLRGLLRAGLISNLVLQPRFPIVVNGVKICDVIPDFQYVCQDGTTVIEDSKGCRTPVFQLKKKLFTAQYAPLKIMEV